MWIFVVLGLAAACVTRPGPLYDCRGNNLTRFVLPETRIWKADFSDNNVYELTQHTFVDRDVTIFVFSGIRVIRTSAFADLPTTTMIYILYGQLVLIEPGAFTAMPMLSQLYISYNNPAMTCFPWGAVIIDQLLQVTLYTATKTISTRNNATDCAAAEAAALDSSAPATSLMVIMVVAAIVAVLFIAGVVYRRKQPVIAQATEPPVFVVGSPVDVLYDMATLPNTVETYSVTNPLELYSDAAPYETADDFMSAQSDVGHFSLCPITSMHSVSLQE